jgi:high affinity sulfate transporter 1
MEGILPVDKARLPAEVIAGITLAALAIPEVMGYATIAGMPVVTGLYTLVLPTILFAFLGSSRHLVVGADSATAAVMAAALAGMAASGSSEYIALAGLLALMAGVLLLLARLVRLGFIANFLSRTVLIGFLTGVGIQVAIGQLAGIIGVPTPHGGSLQKLWDTITAVPDASVATLAVSLSVIATILVLKKVTKKVPGALIAVVGSMVVSKAADLASHGVSVLGTVPGGLPHFGIPNGITWAEIGALVPTALSILVLVLAQSAATSRAYAAKYNESFSENTDLVGLGAASIGAAFSGTFVVNGSPTKTQMVDGAGGRSQLAQLTTGAITVVVLLFLTKPLAYLPNAVLAAIVFLIGLELVDIAGMRKVARLRPDEFFVALATALTVVIVGVEQGIILAIVASVIDHIRRSYRPPTGVMTPAVSGDKSHYQVDAIAPGVRTEPGLVVYRFSASLYYANANFFLEEVSSLISSVEPEKVRWLCINAAGVADIDYSGAETLRQVSDVAQGQGVRVSFAELLPVVRDQFERFGLLELFGADAVYETVADAVAAFEVSDSDG